MHGALSEPEKPAFSPYAPYALERSGASVLAHGLAGERPRFADARRRLLAARAARVRPATDGKLIASWNGFAIGGLATAAACFGREDWLAIARRAADFARARRARALLTADDAVVVLAPGERPEWLAGREPRAGRPTAWLCRGHACSLPASEPDALALPPGA